MIIDQLRDTTTPVTIKRGAAVFTLDAALEKITTDDTVYDALCQKRIDLVLHGDALGKRMENVTIELAGQASAKFLCESVLARRAAKGEALYLPPAAPGASAATRREARKARLAVTEEEMQAEYQLLMVDAEARLQAMRIEAKDIEAAEHMAIAATLAYLVPTSDLVTKDGLPALQQPAVKEDSFAKLIQEISEDRGADPKHLAGVTMVVPAEYEHATLVFYRYMTPALLNYSLREVQAAVFAPLGTSGSSAS